MQCRACVIREHAVFKNKSFDMVEMVIFTLLKLQATYVEVSNSYECSR